MLGQSLKFSECRLLASLFLRSTFLRILKYEDLSQIKALMKEIGCGRSRCKTSGDYLQWAYRQLVKKYPCEYVYKNEFLNRVVMKNQLLRRNVIVNEFKISDSIADFAVFSDFSCAYEIKTKFDSSKRLLKQIECCAKLFDSVSLIVPIEKIDIYRNLVPEQIGLVVMLNDFCGITFEEL